MHDQVRGGAGCNFWFRRFQACLALPYDAVRMTVRLIERPVQSRVQAANAISPANPANRCQITSNSAPCSTRGAQ